MINTDPVYMKLEILKMIRILVVFPIFETSEKCIATFLIYTVKPRFLYLSKLLVSGALKHL
jgi:hypothetical protein